jgi:hypothetical protein
LLVEPEFLPARSQTLHHRELDSPPILTTIEGHHEVGE